MSLFDQISKDIIAAMKAKDKVRLDTLRNIKKLFLEAKTAPGANDELSDADALKIMQKMVKRSFLTSCRKRTQKQGIKCSSTAHRSTTGLTMPMNTWWKTVAS